MRVRIEGFIEIDEIGRKGGGGGGGDGENDAFGRVKADLTLTNRVHITLTTVICRLTRVFLHISPSPP